MPDGQVFSASSVATFMRCAKPDDLYRIIRIAKFWLLVEQSDGCWPWRGALDAGGYGQFERGTKAHRFSFEVNIGPIPDGMLVCHRCDNPPCVRPDHLYAGSSKDNTRDMVGRGRARFSGRCLTLEQVAYVRSLDMKYGDGRRLAARLGVHPMTISRIRTGKAWKGVMPNVH